MKVKYVLMNPTGNRTILVESPVSTEDYKKVATFLMEKEPTAEQVGFLDVTGDDVVTLNMAGGEFCGNATMSAAVYAVLKGWRESPVKIKVSGVSKVLNVEVDNASLTAVKMPSPKEIKNVRVSLPKEEMILPAVIFDGITHIILSGIGIAKNQAEKCARRWADELGVSCLGLMFYDEGKNKLKPLVYVENPGTLIWENSCGSGSVAVAAYLESAGIKKDCYEFAEPGGLLKVIKKGKSFYLQGSAKLEKESTVTIRGLRPEKEKEEEPSKITGHTKKEALKKTNTGSTKKESRKELDERIRAVLAKLDEQYGTDYRCYLNYGNPWQLLFATIMSAQCTDERVNIVTKDLYVKYPTLESFAEADLKELEQDIHSTGFYHHKAKNIIACAQMLLEKYDGEVPSDLESLTSLPGVGRKTANVIRGNIYHIDSIVVDTHVKRISNKLGFTKETDPEKIEFDLMEKLPEDHWILYNIHIITLGRSICKAQNPKCAECFLKELCPEGKRV